MLSCSRPHFPQRAEKQVRWTYLGGHKVSHSRQLPTHGCSPSATAEHLPNLPLFSAAPPKFHEQVRSPLRKANVVLLIHLHVLAI